MNRFVSQKTRVTRSPRAADGHIHRAPPSSRDHGSVRPGQATDLSAVPATIPARTSPAANGIWPEYRRGPAPSCRLHAPDGKGHRLERADVATALFRTASGNVLHWADGFLRCAPRGEDKRPAVSHRSGAR